MHVIRSASAPVFDLPGIKFTALDRCVGGNIFAAGLIPEIDSRPPVRLIIDDDGHHHGSLLSSVIIIRQADQATLREPPSEAHH